MKLKQLQIIAIVGFSSVPVFIILLFATLSPIYDCVGDTQMKYVCSHLDQVQAQVLLLETGIFLGLLVGTIGLVLYFVKKSKQVSKGKEN